jgi:hypothetical protein
MLMLEPDVSVAPFERRGYDTIAADLDGAWLQKRFWPCGVKAWMDRVH